ncbi:MAG: penicillin-binding transpeptidase domain-containing protein, partial [Chthoniobacterales bacterium]
RYMRRNAKGQIEGVLREEAPKQGANVFMTLDARVQAIAEEALRAVSRGAAVVIDPNNGDVLAMASVPSFDPNTFIPSIKAKDWKALQKDEARPLVNRAISAFPPGSTFKIVTSLAGLRKKIGNSRWNCSGGVSYGEHYFHCWIAEKGGSHGTLGLTDAIKVSCDSFFYQYGNAAGIEAINTTGNAMGFGKETGVHLTGESPGIMPGPQWMAIHYPRERWSQAYTANVSIGQGYVLASPLQMAMAYATVANGGVSYYPRLVDRVLNQDGTPLLDDAGKPVVSKAPKIDADLRQDFTREQIEMVRRGLWKVVNEEGGTGGKARLPGVQVAGKTGTAQAFTNGKKDTIAWFCSFAPFDNPKYVVAVMVQGGEHGGSVAAPIATRILQRSLAMDEGKFDAQVAWVAPAHHSNPFQMIPAVDYKDAGPNLASSDDEKSDDSQASDSQMAGAGGDPDVEEEADDAGKVAPVVNRVRRAQAVALPPQQVRQPSFFQRLFGGGRPVPQPTPVPVRRPGRR